MQVIEYLDMRDSACETSQIFNILVMCKTDILFIVRQTTHTDTHSLTSSNILLNKPSLIIQRIDSNEVGSNA